MPSKKPTLRPVVEYSREAVLDKHQLAAGLGVCVAIAMRMDLPFFMAGGRERFIWGQVLDVLAERAMPDDTTPVKPRRAPATATRTFAFPRAEGQGV